MRQLTSTDGVDVAPAFVGDMQPPHGHDGDGSGGSGDGGGSGDCDLQLPPLILLHRRTLAAMTGPVARLRRRTWSRNFIPLETSGLLLSYSFSSLRLRFHITSHSSALGSHSNAFFSHIIINIIIR